MTTKTLPSEDPMGVAHVVYLQIDPDSDQARLDAHRRLHAIVHPDIAAASRRNSEYMALMAHQRNEAIVHLQAILNDRRTATQALESDRAAREWLRSIGSESE